MSEPLSTQVAKLLEENLRAILIANGFHTDLGASVYRGFIAHAVEARDALFPMIAIQPDTESLDGTRESGSKVTAVNRLIIATDDVQQPADVLRACVADVRKLLATGLTTDLNTIGIHKPPELTDVEYALQGDSLFTVAALQVAFTFYEKYGD